MAFNHFVWTDLSTYDLATARKDYGALFGWSFTGDKQYDFALENETPVAAIYLMPSKLQEIGLPSFWMSYVHVENLDASVDKARCHAGAVIEVEPEAFDENSRIALVRDPSGAGFTMYEGPDLSVAPADKPGRVLMRYHHVPDLSLIQTFYEDLFGWHFRDATSTPVDWPVFDVQHENGDLLAQVEIVPESIRGKYRYWKPCFSISSDLPSTFEIQTKFADGRIMLADQQQASLMVKSYDS